GGGNVVVFSGGGNPPLIAARKGTPRRQRAQKPPAGALGPASVGAKSKSSRDFPKRLRADATERCACNDSMGSIESPKKREQQRVARTAATNSGRAKDEGVWDDPQHKRRHWQWQRRQQRQHHSPPCD